MAATQSILFSWDNVEALPDLQRLELVFRYLPDQDIIAALQQMRGHGRNDFPVATMWRALLAGVVFQHESIESLLRELRRNPALLTLCEFDPVPLQSPPKKVLERVDGVLRVNSISQPQRSTIYKTARAVACILSFAAFDTSETKCCMLSTTVVNSDSSFGFEACWLD